MASADVETRHSAQRVADAAESEAPEALHASAGPNGVEVAAAEAQAAGASEAARTSFIEPNAAEVQAPLWPKEPKEWGLFVLDMAPIGMVVSAFSGSCPAIGSLPAFVLSFAALNVSVGAVKFVFSLRRCGQAERYKAAKSVADVLGLLLLGVGVWGIAIVYPNLRYLKGPASECEFQPFLGAFIPSTIILVVLVVLALFVAKAMFTSLSNPPEGQRTVGEAVQQQEKNDPEMAV